MIMTRNGSLMPSVWLGSAGQLMYVVLHTHTASMLDLTVGQNLRVTQQQPLSIDMCCPRLILAANPSAAATAVDRWDRQTDGRTDIRPFYDAHAYTDRVTTKKSGLQAPQ